MVLGELQLGILKSKNPREELKVFEALLGITILDANGYTAFIYASIRRELEESGASIPQNDIWIAASSIQAGVPLITRDEHFRRISGLKVISY